MTSAAAPFAICLAVASACGSSESTSSSDDDAGTSGNGGNAGNASGGRGGSSGTAGSGAAGSGATSGIGGEGGDNPGTGGTATGGTATGGADTGGTGGRPCPNETWACQVVDCAAENLPRTTLSATVYDPAGRMPLYNVAVYVPNTALAPIADGAICETCRTPVSGEPIASALTDSQGRFVMADVPVGMNVPLVMQIGKWRREIVLPEIRRCQENPFDDANLFRLPRNKTEGHIPKIAVTTGESDQLECLLRRIGVDAAEFTNPDGTGRINLFTDPCTAVDCETAVSSYESGGAPIPSAYEELWNSVDSLRRYDLVLMSCTGAQSAGRDKTTQHKQALKDYVDTGGRVLVQHFHHAWLRGGNEALEIEDARKYTTTPFPVIATWATAENPDIAEDISHQTARDYDVDTSFPKGSAFADWLVAVGASPARGVVSLLDVVHPALAVEPVARRWIYSDTTAVAGVGAVPFFSVNTPIEQAGTPELQCGRLAHTGIHVGALAGDDVAPFDYGCADVVPSAQEKAAEFLIFELSSCVMPDDAEPEPPATR